MQNLNGKETIQKIKQAKSDIKKELEESIGNGKTNENADMQEKVNGCTTNEDAVKSIQEFEQINKKQKEQYCMASLLPRPNISQI